MTNPLVGARNTADDQSQTEQDRNRLWWEQLPMTYFDWASSDRLPHSPEGFAEIRHLLLSNSPFLRDEFDFSALAGKSVLDLGCGSGVLSCLLAEAGAAVTAADLTETAIKLTREWATQLSLDIEAVQTDAESLVFADNSFDYVFSWGVLHHSKHTEQAFAEVKRVLRPGGSGLVMVYHKTSAVYYLKGLQWLILKGKIFQGYGFQSVQRFFTDGYFHRHFTRRQLHKALTEAGLEVTDVIVTQMEKKIFPGLPVWLDRMLKKRFGWLIIARFHAPADTGISGGGE